MVAVAAVEVVVVFGGASVVGVPSGCECAVAARAITLVVVEDVAGVVDAGGVVDVVVEGEVERLHKPPQAA